MKPKSSVQRTKAQLIKEKKQTQKTAKKATHEK
jgi:hypothetical protein